jgi:hypothetical protein
MQAHIEGSPVLPMQMGFNTRRGLDAMPPWRSAASAGLLDFLEGLLGYFSLIDPEWDPASFDTFESREAITELSHKPFPSGRAAHGGVDGLSHCARGTVSILPRSARSACSHRRS